MKSTAISIPIFRLILNATCAKLLTDGKIAYREDLQNGIGKLLMFRTQNYKTYFNLKDNLTSPYWFFFKGVTDLTHHNHIKRAAHHCGIEAQLKRYIYMKQGIGGG